MKLLGLALLAGIVGAAIWYGARRGDAPSGVPVPGPLPDRPSFLGSESCRACHEDRHETWLETAHAYSLREPRDGSVEGRFDGTTVESPHFLATPYRKGEEYRMRLDGRDGRPSGDYAVSRVIGRSFEQAYLLTSPLGEWRVLPLCWSIERKEWDRTHLVLADIAGSAGAIPENYDSRDHVFNHGCGQCHATAYNVGYDLAAGTYHSTFLEGAVSCESCHGPGSVHAAWHRREESHRREAPPAAVLLHPKRDLDARQVLDSCGRCHYMHEWRYAIDDDPRVGYREISLSDNNDRPGFLADGRLAGLNYHGSTQSQSACFTKGGMSCLSCHRMHGGKKWAMKWEENDDAQCAQCHPDVAAQGSTHTHHEDVRCVDCHMPKFMKGVLHFMRDHSIRSPDPALTERFGEANSPNACNVCHVGEGPKWAREQRDHWWGPGGPGIAEGTQLVLDLRGDAASVPTPRLADMALSKDRLLFFRSTAVRALAWRPKDPAAREAVRAILRDAEPELVQVACDGIGARPHPEHAGALLPLLDHPARTVRVEAAYALGRCGWRGTTPALERAYAETLRRFERQRPYPGSLEAATMLAEMTGRDVEAERHFADLMRIDPYPAGRWPDSGVDALESAGRRLTDRGEHGAALGIYARVLAAAGGAASDLYHIDSADSWIGTNLPENAVKHWRILATEWPPASSAARLGRLRIEAATGDVAGAIAGLDALAKEVAKDPAGGKMLRRVRYALALLRGS